MADEKISAMTLYAGSPGQIAQGNTSLPVVQAGSTTNFRQNACDVVMSPTRGRKKTLIHGTNQFNFFYTRTYYCVTSGGGTDTVEIRGAGVSAGPYGTYHCGYNGAKITVGCYTHTAGGDKIKIVGPTLNGFKLKPSRKFAGSIYVNAVYLTGAKQYAVFELENGYWQWDYDGSYGIAIASQTITNNTPTADPGHSGMIWRDASGFIHQHP